ncbi:acetone carboxylase subunit gamma [Chloroflexota bacterium]
MRIHEYLEMVEEKGQVVIRCSKCQHIYCSPSENFLEKAICAELPLPVIAEKRPEHDKFVLRAFYCPGCQTSLHREICRPEDPLIKPISIEVGV